jgi:hypothetical protein
MKDCVTVAMLVECFKDHHAFETIDIPDTLVHDLMFDQIFLYEVDEKSKIEFQQRLVSIPRLMLLGMLYCASNR